MLMLRYPKTLLISNLIILLRIRTKHSHRYNYRNDEDEDEDDNHHKRKQNHDDFFHLYKNWGQHILTNQKVLHSIIQYSDIKPTDTVLEIGPGTGNLTLKLLEASKHVIALEIDKRMVEILNKNVIERGLEDKLTVICKDALRTEFPPFDLVVANIPYNISSPLLAKLVFGGARFRSATLLVQKEFARRLLANPGDWDYNRLAVDVKLVCDVKFVMDVSKRHFVPCPKVESSVVMVYPKDEVPDVDLDEWGAFTRTCFGKKNKTLGATFKQKKKVLELYKLFEGKGSDEESSVECCDDDENNVEEDEVSGERDVDLATGLESELSIFKDKIVAVLKSGGFEDKRPSKLCNEDLLKLLSLFNQSGIHFHDKAKPRDVQLLTL